MKNCKSHKSCIKEALTKAKIICDQRGVKLTKLRETVLKLIWKNHSYVKAYDLLEELKKIDHSAKPPTVYRSLDFLIEIYGPIPYWDEAGDHTSDAAKRTVI